MHKDLLEMYTIFREANQNKLLALKLTDMPLCDKEIFSHLHAYIGQNNSLVDINLQNTKLLTKQIEELVAVMKKETTALKWLNLSKNSLLESPNKKQAVPHEDADGEQEEEVDQLIEDLSAMINNGL